MDMQAPLLETKLHPAIGAADPLIRDALKLPQGLEDGTISLVTVTAPAGYGKSTLMAQWRTALDQKGVRSGWLNLDEDDNDLARFGRYLSGALVQGGLDESSTSVLRAQRNFARGSQAVLETLAADLNTLRQRLVVFIDDVHVLSSPDVVEIIRWLVNYAPSQVQFVLGSRSDVPVPLGRLRVRRKLIEFGVEALKFNTQEAAVLMQSRLNRELPVTDIKRLVERTEGWPAGLELAGLILDGVEKPSEVISTFAGNSEGVMEYLGEVLLENLDKRTRETIFHIAQFDRVNAALIAAATQTEEGAARSELQRLHSSNLFLKKMDAQGRWYRFHHLVGQFFREQGTRQMPDAVRASLIRGAEFLMTQRLRQEALHAVFRAREWDRASAWLAEHIEDLVFERGHVQTALEWSRQLPPEYALRHPDILLQSAFAMMVAGQLDQARAVLDRLTALRAQLAEDPACSAERLAEFDCALGMHESHYAGFRDDMVDALRVSEEWMQKWPDAPGRSRASVANVLAFAYKCYGDIDRGLAINSEGKRLAQELSAHYLMSWNLTIESFLHLKRGDLAAAEDAANRLLHYMDEHLSRIHPHAGHAHSVLAFVYYEREEIDKAREHIELIHELEPNPQADFLILNHLTRSRLLVHDGETDAAIQSLISGRELAEKVGLRRASLTLVTEEINLLCSVGRIEEARESARCARLHIWPDAADIFTLQGDKAARVCTRLYMSEDPETVIARCQELQSHCVERGMHHRQVEWLLLEAQAKQSKGDSAGAADCVGRALVIGADEGYLRVFRDHCEILKPVMSLVQFDQDHIAAAHLLERLLKKSQKTEAPHKVHSKTEMVEELTKRELQILQRLRSDLSNREIAEAIFVSEGTLKWHLHNIYGKLSVKNRSGALMRATELQLL